MDQLVVGRLKIGEDTYSIYSSEEKEINKYVLSTMKEFVDKEALKKIEVYKQTLLALDLATEILQPKTFKLGEGGKIIEQTP